MKSGLVLPRFYPNDSIQGERVDEHIKTLAEQINGGLTGQSFAPQYKIPLASFAEQRSAYTLTAYGDGLQFPSIMNAGVLNVAARLIGVSFNIAIPQSSVYLYIGVGINPGVTVRANSTGTNPVLALNLKNQLIDTSSIYVNCYDSIFPAGSLISVNWNPGTGVAHTGYVSVHFASLHTS